MGRPHPPATARDSFNWPSASLKWHVPLRVHDGLWEWELAPVGPGLKAVIWGVVLDHTDEALIW